MPRRVFLDTNVLIYAFTEDTEKSVRAMALVESPGGMVSVQVLNEFVNVLQRRFKMGWGEIEDVMGAAYNLFSPVQALTEAVHHKAVQIARRYQYRIFDSNLIASALLAGCDTLYTEDLSDSQQIEGLTIRNPFTALA